MPNERDQLIRMVTREQAALLRTENSLVREVLAAYRVTRRDLAQDFQDRFDALPANPSQAQIRALASDATLIQSIDRRMAELELALRGILAPAINEIGQGGFEAAAAEVTLLAQALGVDVFTFGTDALLEVVVAAVIEQIPLEVETFRQLLISEMRQGLAAGEPIRDIQKRLFSTVPVDGRVSVFRRGQVSAELMTRRGVIQANNNAKLLFLEEAAPQVPDLKKQAVATIGARTTQTCLRVHGQIREIDEGFTLTGSPRFSRSQQASPFHWNCRTTITAYHASFESGSALSTAEMRQAAAAEAESRKN